MLMWASLVIALLGTAYLPRTVAAVAAAGPYLHSWDTVADVMGVHGYYKDVPTAAEIEFVTSNYAMITMGTGCNDIPKGTTIEENVIGVAARVKKANPKVKIGMYWRSDFALELADCSGFSSEWSAHPEWRLRDDAGNLINRTGSFYLDYTNPSLSAFFAHVLVNVTTWTMPSGDPVLDYVYIDGDPIEAATKKYQDGIGPTRSNEIVNGLYNCFADIQRQLEPSGRKVILNGMDDVWSATKHVSTGAAGSMFDHWTILQFLNSTNGDFQLSLMDEAFALATSSILANTTLKVKGWPGPIIQQRDIYPPNIPTPKTPADLQQVALDRFNSELAFFLLVAEAKDYWVYSWFWNWDDYVPNKPDSTVPPSFFPQVKCSLGNPLGLYQRVPGTWTYTRKFETASVFVDLTNRTASHVDFIGCDL